jgi:hypothetical protein
MAQKVELEFSGGGSLFEDLAKVQEVVRSLRDTSKTAQENIQADLKKSTQVQREFSQAIGTTVKVVAELGKQAASGAGNALNQSFRTASEGAAVLEEGVTSVGVAAENSAKGIEKIGGAAAGAGKKSAEAISVIRKEAKAVESVVGQTVKITADQYKKMAAEAAKAGVSQEDLLEVVGETALEAEGIGNSLRDSNDALSPTIENLETLQQQLRNAKKEAGALAAEFGVDSEQAVKAQQRVGELANQVQNLNQRFEAFDPGRKFQAFNQLTFSLINGFSAVQGVVGAIAGENEGLQKILYTFQGLLFATSNIQGFLGGFKDSLKTIRALFALNTVAVQANNVALAENAVGSAAAGTAAAGSASGFAVATTSVKAFTVSLLTNPIFLAVAAITALGAALFFAGEDAETAAEKMQKFNDQLDLFREWDNAAVDLKKDLDALDLERRNLNIADTDFEGQAAAAREAARIEKEALNSKVALINENLRQTQQELDAIKGYGDEEVEARKIANEKIQQLTREKNGIVAQGFRVNAQLLLDQDRIEKAAIEKAIADARERKALREGVIEAERELAKQLRDAERAALGENDPFLRVELTKTAAEEELKELERGFLRKLAQIELQKRLGVDAFRDLTEAEKNARADQLIDQGAVKLSIEQQEAFNRARLQNEEQYLEELRDLYDAQAKLRVDIMAEGSDKAKAQFQLDLKDRIDALKKAGIDEIEIADFVVQETLAFQRKAAQEAITLDEQLQVQRIKNRENNGEIEKVFIRKQQIEINAVELAAAQARLETIKSDGTKETELLKEQAQFAVNELLRARAELLNNPVQVDLLDLLGVQERDKAAVRQAFADIFASVQSIIAAGIAEQRAEVEARIEATDEIIADAQRRKDELKGQLEEELQNQREGYANNVDAIRASIAEQEKAERQALATKKALQAEAAKLARQQVLLDGIAQASSLATSVANLIKTWSTLPLGVGLLSAFAQAASIAAFFTQTKAKLAAAAQGQQFYKGTKSVKRGPGERPGIDTVHAMLTEGEAVVPVAKKRKHNRLVDAIIDDDFSKLRHIDIAPLLKGTGIRLEGEEVEKVTRLHMEHDIARNHSAKPSDMSGLEQRVDYLTATVQKFQKQEKDRPTVTTLPDGRLMVTKGSDVHFITPRKR